MALKLQPQNPSIRRDNFPQEKDFILMKYPGIFKKNIKEYAEKVIPRFKNIKNYSK
jgi:hypothetical protein